MEDREYRMSNPVPANYTDSGKLFGGLLKIRNTVEAAIVLLGIGYPELMFITAGLNTKVIVMTVTLIPLVLLAAMGIRWCSLYCWDSSRELYINCTGANNHANTIHTENPLK